MTDVTTLPVLVPAPVGEAEALLAHLRADGFTVDHTPFVELRLHQDADTRHAVAALAEGRLAHLVAAGPRALEALTLPAESPAELLAGFEITAIGEETAQALREQGLDVTRVLTPAELVAAPPAPATPGAGLLLAGPSSLDPSLGTALTAAGHAVTPLVTHRVRSVSLDPQIVRDLRLHGYGAIVLTSPMLADLAGHLGIHRDIRVIAADAETSAKARARRLIVHGEAASTSARSLADAVVQALATEIVHG